MAKKVTPTRGVKEQYTPTQATRHQLVDLYLQRANVSRDGMRSDGAPPPHLQIDVSVNLGRKEDDDYTIFVLVEFKASSSYDPEGPAAIVLEASFFVAYRTELPLPKELPREAAEFFSDNQAMLHVWPYWREFVQSATSRMGLPPLRMPLVLTGNQIVKTGVTRTRKG